MIVINCDGVTSNIIAMTLSVLLLGNTEPLPPITSKPKPKATAIGEKDENGKPTSYQLVFDQVRVK